MLFLDVNENDMDNAGRLQEMIDNKKNVFVLVYMIGCTPCKHTLPEWNKLKGCKEMEQFKNNDDIIVANVEQSMCEKMHHKDLENINTFPTIKHIQHNDVHNYNDERSTSAFSKWIKSLIKKDGKLNDINHLVITNQDKTNHGNIDILMKNTPTVKIKPKTTKNRTKTNSIRKRKLRRRKTPRTTKTRTPRTTKTRTPRTTKTRTPRTTKTRTSKPRTSKPRTTKTRTSKARRTKTRTSKPRTTKTRTSKARRTFQTPLSYTKSLPA